jgi:hypothetical protein
MRTASIIPKELVPCTFCWTVLIVSNGARIVLAHAAARPDANVLFNPSTNADDDDDEDDGSADALEIMDEFDFVAAVVVPPRGRTPKVVDVADKFLLFLLDDNDEATTALLLVDVDSEDSSSSDSRNNNAVALEEWTIMIVVEA